MIDSVVQSSKDPRALKQWVKESGSCIVDRDMWRIVAKRRLSDPDLLGFCNT